MSLNDTGRIAYDDLREWLSEAQRLGEVRMVRGANWQEDIGLAAEAVLRAENGPCVVFEDIDGCPPGFRLLMNMFAGTRRNMTLGFPDHLTKWELSDAYRAQVFDKSTIGILIAPGHHGGIHREKYFKRGEPMPVAMVVGGDPLAFFYGGIEVPYGTFEFDVIGGLRGRPEKMVRGKVTGLPIPAHAEIVIEGYVHPDRTAIEGPFGEWSGHYAGGAKPCTVIDIKAIYHRNDPIMLGVPPMGAGPDEMARYRAVMRSATIKQNMTNAGVPEVRQVWCHEVGGARMFHGIAIKQCYAGHATQAGMVAAQCGASAYASKYIVVTDEDVDVTNLENLIWAMLTRTDPKESIQFIDGSVAVINACRPYHWRDQFPPANTPNAET